ncbi:MAG: protein phosphatase 2C domain-containing protein [Muribaculaceae bacterium]|nr:protein phosphatase 2C domain-containing protein [Muribaculaceae bacterium]
MNLNYEALSHVGLCREINQDMAMVMQQTIRDDTDSFSFDIPDEEDVTFKFAAIVCDGLGGHAKGEVASEMACESFREFVDNIEDDLDDNELIMKIKHWFRLFNENLISAGQGVLTCTTLTGLLLYGETLVILNCGDSRTYRLRFGKMTRLTTDHSERERTGNPDMPSSRMYNCLGIPSAFIDIKIARMVEGDRYLICSDGLTDMVEEQEIYRFFAEPLRLMQMALNAGGYDNVTIVGISAK